MKNKAAKQKAKRKGAKDTAFGCDLGEHLQNSNQDVPQVLKSCAEFIEKHGIVDGVYRLSGITSNIQRLRQEFGTEQRPDLTKEVYLQDIHCVGSLCKLYFRELPNPLLTYELYKKFTEAVTAQSEEEQLVRIQNVIKELPPPHYRTLEYLSKHLTHIASFSTKTNMHSRNLALVWAPNLLRSKEIEGSGYNNDAAFLEVRVQSIVIEFILNHVNQLFNSNTAQPKQDTEAHNPVAKCKSLPIVSPSMKLLSLEEAQARTLKPDHPARLEKIHCAPMDTGPAAGTIYHTVIDLPDPRRKLSAKTKKWKSIFNLGRLGNDSKGKLSRNGSVFVRAPQFAEKGNIRPAKSMESLCSLPIEDEGKGVRFKHGGTLGGGLSSSMKSHTLGSACSYNLSRRHSDWDQEDLVGAIGGCVGNISSGTPDKEPAILKAQPEQMKVFRGDAFNKSEPSPKTRRLFYSTNLNDSSPKSNFPGNLFPLEASPRHHRKPMAVNISEPFSVSVPLHVSGIISPSATPCKEAQKDGQSPNDPGSQESMDRPSPAESSIISMASEEKGDLLRRQTDSDQHEFNDEEDIEKAGLKTEPLVVSTNSSSQNQPKLSLNPTHQDSDALQPLSSSESVTTSSVSPKPFESTEPEEVPPSIVPSTGRPCEDEHQRPCSGSNEEQPATKQDTDSSAKLSMEHLWPHTKELKIIEPEEITGPHIFLEKMEENLVQSRDDSHIEYTPLPDASTAVNTTGQQRMHSLPNLFLQSSPLMVETVPEEMSLNATSNKCSSEGNSTKTPDQSQAQQIKSMGSLLSASSKMELKHPITDKNILKALTESSPTECFGASVDSSQLIDTNSDVKDQYLIASHEFQSSEPCINKPEPNSKIDIKFSKLCSDVSNKSDQEEQLADISSNLKSEALPTDTSEPGIPGKHWMDNDTLKQPSSLSLQLVEVKNDEEECLAKISPDVRPDEWQYAAQELWSPDACTDKLAPEEHYDMSSQSVNKIVWNSQSPETPLPICNGESLSNSSLVIKSVNFLREMEGTSIHQQRTISPAEENSIASSKLDGLHVVSTGTTPCLESINVESTVVTPDRTEADCFKSEDKAPIVASYSTVNNKPSVSDGSPVQSIPVGVTAVRTTYMIKMCQVKAIPVIPPKVQFTQVPQPLPKKNLTPPSLPLDKVLTILQPVAVCEPSCPDSKQRLDSSLTNSSVAEPEDGKENGLPKSQTPEHGWCTISPDISLTQSKTSQAAPVVKKTSKANGEDLLDSPSPLRMERSAVQQKPAFTRHAQHRSKASRPQSLILFSPPWPSMERPSPVEPSKVPLSPVKSSPEPQTPEPDHPTPSSYSHELTDSQKGLEGVTLRNHMSMPKSGQRLETSTSCFYQPQRRSMIFENRGGRQIE
ncbi:rho GTPase-activating protein 31 isoform X1 [Pristis pectinata]|uniref:rho GTPase-activating protein 31 isoform X1 n=1 Tax=Pristis pectinata TaxID=685728 RepID=UPI00223D8D05|nr:rho GTPase-activating protein 31 isoform X1 [Pristis pectinata]